MVILLFPAALLLACVADAAQVRRPESREGEVVLPAGTPLYVQAQSGDERQPWLTLRPRDSVPVGGGVSLMVVPSRRAEVRTIRPLRLLWVSSGDWSAESEQLARSRSYDGVSVDDQVRIFESNGALSSPVSR